MKIYKKEPSSDFINDIWIALPLHRKQEKRFIKEIRENVSDFTISDPAVTKNDLILKFGEPTDIIADYFNSLEPEEYIGSMRRTRYFKRVSHAIVVFLCVLLCIFTYFENRAYNEWKTKQIAMEDETIQIDE